jgi:hypothetical protein
MQERALRYLVVVNFTLNGPVMVENPALLKACRYQQER